MESRNITTAPTPEDRDKNQVVPNEKTVEDIENARNGVGLSRGFSTVKDFTEDLDADD